MKNFTEKEYPEEYIEWFSFELTRVQSYYLYVISVIGIFYFFGLLIQILHPILLYVIDLLFSLPIEFVDIISLTIYLGITSLFPILCIGLFYYSIKKLKPPLSKSISKGEKDEIIWFGVLINKNQASILFMLALIGIIYSLIGIFSSFSYFSLLIDWGLGSLDTLIIDLIESLIFSLPGILILLASLHTIFRTRKLTSDDSEKPLWFGFELKKDVRFIIYVGSIIGILTSAISAVSLTFFIWRSLIEWWLWTYLYNYILILGVMLSILLLSVYSFFKIRKM